jgi:hypothetical protein
MHMIARVVAVTEQDMIEQRNEHTERISLDASIYVELMQTCGPKKLVGRDQLYPTRQRKSMPKANPNPNPNTAPTLRPTATPTPRATSILQWATVSVPTLLRLLEIVPP